MKGSLLFSLILHVLLLSLALYFIPAEKKEPPPFFARIVTPDELNEKKSPGQRPSPHSKPSREFHEEKTSRMPKLPKEFQPPKELSAIPSRRMPAKDRREMQGNALRERAQKAVQPRSSLSEGKSSGTAPVDDHREASRKEELSSALSGPSGMLKQGTGEGDSSGKSPSSITGSKASPPKTLREKLYDKNIIGQLAQKGKDNGQPENGITFDTRDYKYYGYTQRLRERIESMWRYPQEAAAKGIYGDLYVKFTIKKSGELGAVELVRTSGHTSLDDAAIKALREAEPFWPLPESWDEDGLTITGHFVYSLYGFSIR